MCLENLHILITVSSNELSNDGFYHYSYCTTVIQIINEIAMDYSTFSYDLHL
jgi:hypothetical protein